LNKLGRKRGVKVNLGLSLLFSLIVLIIVFITAALTSVIGYILYQTGAVNLLSRRNPLWIMAILFLVSIVISTIISVVSSKYTLRPIQLIIDAINRLAAGDFSVRLDLKKPPEVAELADSFNLMAEELGHTELLRTDFVNNFSHEFKTPIVSIMGFAEMMKYSDLTDEKRDEYLDIVIDETSRLSKLSTSVLNLSKVENQAILENQTSVNVGEQIRKNIILLQNKWEQKHLNLLLDIQDVVVFGNKEMLGQIWFNMIENAIKFAPQSSDISIELQANDNRIVFTIVNGGKPIPPHQLPYIFNKFYQGDTSHHTSGNGIGLALVKRIVILHHGTIGCRSDENSGTEFTITLPTSKKRMA